MYVQQVFSASLSPRGIPPLPSAQPAVLHSPLQTHKIPPTSTRAHTQALPSSGTQPSATTPCHGQDSAGHSERTSGLLQLNGGKRATQNIDGACRSCQLSVPRGIKQACQTQHKGGEILTAQLRKASKNSTNPGQIFFSTGSKISDFIRIAISRQVDFKPGLKFLFQFKAKLTV